MEAIPYGGKKKGADSGIDGFIYFKPDGKTTEKVIVSVKGGDTVSVPMIRDLAHVVDRENAKIGLFITLAEPTKPMKTEAVKTGYFETPYGKYPKIQILTIAELFAGAKPTIPLIDPTAFKKSVEELTTKQAPVPRDDRRRQAADRRAFLNLACAGQLNLHLRACQRDVA
ncbi:MAG: restriction endonuclease [Candidatus Sulfotelmatobacter sp.]